MMLCVNAERKSNQVKHSYLGPKELFLSRTQALIHLGVNYYILKYNASLPKFGTAMAFLY